MEAEGPGLRRLTTEKVQGCAASVRLAGALRCGRRQEAVEEASSAARGTGAGKLRTDDGERMPCGSYAGRASLWADDGR